MAFISAKSTVGDLKKLLGSFSNVEAHDILSELEDVMGVLKSHLSNGKWEEALMLSQILSLVIQSDCERMGEKLSARNFKAYRILSDVLSVALVNEIDGHDHPIQQIRFVLLQLLEVLIEGCGDLLKEFTGKHILPLILSQFENVESQNYRINRSCASIIINLVRGSKTNKNRLGNGREIVSAMNASDDFFFQMQCVELMLRLYRNGTHLLELSGVGELLSTGIRGLPNDETVLVELKKLVERWNRHLSTDTCRILDFHAIEVLEESTGRNQLMSSTTVYFSRSLLIISDPVSPCTNITVPYELIRKLKFGKEHVEVVLNRTLIDGETLSRVGVAESTSMDPTLSIRLSASVMISIRKSMVQKWITDRRKLFPSRTMKRSRSPARALSTAAAVATIQSPGKVASPKIESPAKPDILGDLRNTVSANISKRREVDAAILGRLWEAVQVSIDEYRKISRIERDQLENDAQRDVENIRQAQTHLQDLVQKAVADLNAGLQELQSVGAIVKDQIAEVEQHFVGGMQELKETEVMELQTLKKQVESQMSSMEAVLSNLESHANPLQLLYSSVQ